MHSENMCSAGPHLSTYGSTFPSDASHSQGVLLYRQSNWADSPHCAPEISLHSGPLESWCMECGAESDEGDIFPDMCSVHVSIAENLLKLTAAVV